MRTTIENLGNGLELVKVFDENGNLYRKYQKLNDELHGEHISYYKSGSIENVTNYKNGKRHGEEVHFYENGVVAFKCNYINNEPVGECFSYHQNGNIKFKSIVKEDKLYEFNENGELINEYNLTEYLELNK